MNKLIFPLFLFVAVVSQAYSVQIIHSPNSSRDAQATYELNQQEERQEMMRQQLRLQQQQLQVQQQLLEQQRQQQYR